MQKQESQQEPDLLKRAREVDVKAQVSFSERTFFLAVEAGGAVGRNICLNQMAVILKKPGVTIDMIQTGLHQQVKALTT